MNAPSLGTRWEGCEPGSDPRYSCGWHYRKNKFNKERRQFERMSSFETQATRLARPRFSRPPPPHSANPGPEASAAPHSLPSPPGGPRKTRRSPPGSAAARAQSLPASGCHLGLAAPPRPHPARWWGRGSSPGRDRGAQARGLGASAAPGGACARGRVGECARARVCVALRLPSGFQRARGPPGLLFPGSQPGPPPS